MKNPFIKYVMKDKKEDIFHSSAYGKAQNGEVIGVASTESFDERMKVEQNRQVVQGYNDSAIVNGTYKNGPKAKKYVPPEKEQKENIDRVGVVKPTVAPSSGAASKVSKTFIPNIKPNLK